MKTFNVLVYPPIPSPKGKKWAYQAHLIAATSALAAGWRLIQASPYCEPLSVRNIVAVSEGEGQPFMPWAGHLRDFDPRDRTTKRWPVTAHYVIEEQPRAATCQVCAPDLETIEERLQELDVYQPQDIKLQWACPNSSGLVRFL